MVAHSTGVKRLVLVLVAVLCLGGVARPHAAQPVRRSLGEGGAIRIVSLVPALTEMLFALGAGPQVVGVSNFDDYPPAVTSLPRVGALLDPNMERILSLRPDLVIVYGSQTEAQQQLERARIRIYRYRHAGLAGILSTLRELGTAIGRPQDGERLAREIQAHLDRIKARVAGRPRFRTLLVFERDPGSLRGIFVSGGVGFLHDMLDIAGGSDVFADVARESVQPSIETILARAPEVILEVRVRADLPPAQLRKERSAWATLSSIPAVKTDRVHILTGQFLVVPGPRVGQATEAIARILHPEAFK
jgi:iron complex transport system substrate-binding protein